MMDETAITMRGIRAGYGARTVLHGITARVPRARVTALVGHNGSGKSTLLGVLAGSLAPSAGTLERSGDRRPALVLQHTDVPAALPLTARDAVAMGRWAHRGWWRRLTGHDRAVVAQSMERVGVADLARRQLGELSGGQYQRVLIAQGLAQRSDLLLLDEPGAGLDQDARERILEIFAELAADGVTIVHATHDAGAAGRADHRLLLREGRLVTGEPAPEPSLEPFPRQGQR
ncbi:zinc ABC transporter ATP-binding protein AztA [Actinomadura algeriensis]|uniref:Zinc/manganese transport system ATP-binding protein n=1 Tax=Actinomadura algeriensis TaxID=1679523 RepID=A0ABR9K4Z4_9ACTN|nr:zinc ABC transporter ATP-binding protein AztA [Actinomadura algeriensis]MBE1537465.1 zinc/manganese transport system ATP-binding protein [Actinomadura algeriensis]